MSEKQLDENKLTGIAALMVHASKIDGNYTADEKDLISNFLYLFSKEKKIVEKILQNAEDLEKNSNQLLDFTKIIKDNSLESKSIVIKEIWKIIISDNKVDKYESNLMRRICGLIYFPDKLSGEIKLSILKEFKSSEK
jgi:uncharacterized tellurite resistance protein B-like protein